MLSGSKISPLLAAMPGGGGLAQGYSVMDQSTAQGTVISRRGSGSSDGKLSTGSKGEVVMGKPVAGKRAASKSKRAASKSKRNEENKKPPPQRSDSGIVSLGEAPASDNKKPPPQRSDSGIVSLGEAPAEERKGSEDGSRKGSEDNTWRKLIAESWKELKENENGVAKQKKEEESQNQESREKEEIAQAARLAEEKKQQASKSRFRFWGNSGNAKSAKEQEQETGKESKQNNGLAGTNMIIPQTFDEMLILNANMIQANQTYIKIVKDCFQGLVAACVSGDDQRLNLESSIMALRIYRDVKDRYQIKDFKVCMLASLRSRLPKSWSIDHEAAWARMWDMVTDTLGKTLPLPQKYEKEVAKLINNMDPEEKRQFGLNAFNRFFDTAPKSEDFFKASNNRLSMLAQKGLDMTLQMYTDPTQTVKDAQSLGLRHIMYSVKNGFFEDFVNSIVEEIRSRYPDSHDAIDGIEWALGQIATIMIYTIEEGSNPLLMAVVANSPKKVREALKPLARKDRAMYCL